MTPDRPGSELDPSAVLRDLDGSADPWTTYRVSHLQGHLSPEVPMVPGQDELGAVIGPGGRASPGATGEMICHLAMLGLGGSGPAVIAADWLEDIRTPAQAWLDAPDEVPGGSDAPAGGRVWATASATCALLAIGRDPGTRALMLLRGEADVDGRLTGGFYPTVAAAGAFWLTDGARSEMSEWALRWARQEIDDYGPWELVSALTFWLAARIPTDHPAVDLYTSRLRESAPIAGWPDDVELTLRAVEVLERRGK